MDQNQRRRLPKPGEAAIETIRIHKNDINRSVTYTWDPNHARKRFGAALNCGMRVNSIGNQECPFLSTNQSRFFFSSDRHPGFGGKDVFFGNCKWDFHETGSFWSSLLTPLPTTIISF